MVYKQYNSGGNMKTKIKDYKNKSYNLLTIITLVPDSKGETIAKCKCKCGNICYKKLSMIKINHVKSCGCLAKSTRFTKNSKKKLLNDFSKLDAASAYWLGFIFGDGNISDSNKLQLCLGSESKKHLIKFSKFLIGSNIVKDYDNRCTFQFTSDILANNISKYGIIPRKTWYSTLKLPSDQLLWPDFIRGYWDADGWVSIKKQTNKNKVYTGYNIGICSYLPENLETVSKALPVKYKKPTKIKNKDLYQLIYQNKSEIKVIAKYLLNNHLYIDYKWKKILHLLD